MTRTVTAEYLAAEQKLKLDEPLEGVEDHQRLEVVIDTRATGPTPPGWRSRGVLSEEAGREIAAAVREAFGRDEIEV